MSDFAMLDCGSLYAVMAVSGEGHDWMRKFYTGYDPLRGKVLWFDDEAMQDFIRSTVEHQLTIEGVRVDG